MRARGHYMDINKFSPKFKVSSPNLINLSGLTTEDIFEYLYAAKALKTKYRAGENPALLKHKTIALLFGNVSTRTRISFEMGIRQLGGDFLFLPNCLLHHLLRSCSAFRAERKPFQKSVR